MYFFIKCLMSSAILLLAVLKSDIAIQLNFEKLFLNHKNHKNYFKIDHVTIFYRKYLEKHSYSQKTMLYDDVQMTSLRNIDSLRNGDVTAIMYVPNYCTIFGRFCGNYFNIGRVIFYIHIYYKFCLFFDLVRRLPILILRRWAQVFSRSP